MADLRQPPSVESFGAGGFRVGGERIEGSVLILDDRARPWAPRELAALTPADFDAAVEAGRELVEFVLLGVGTLLRPAPRPVREHLAARGVGLEVMTTPEACRLYNVMAADGRRLAAALLAV